MCVPTLLVSVYFVDSNQSFQVKHRIMIDVDEYSSAQPFIFGPKVFTSGLEAIEGLSDEDIMTCSARIDGYSLESKQWFLHLVECVTEVAYNDMAFHGLVLQEQKKKLISTLLKRQDREQHDDFDDLIQGKGKGLIFLLYGPPGVGKTYTAGLFSLWIQKTALTGC